MTTEEAEKEPVYIKPVPFEDPDSRNQRRKYFARLRARVSKQLGKKKPMRLRFKPTSKKNILSVHHRGKRLPILVQA